MGNSWTEMKFGPEMKFSDDLSFVDTNFRMIEFATGHKFFSEDGGKTWMLNGEPVIFPLDVGCGYRLVKISSE